MLENLMFKGTWRSYQQKVLDNLQKHLSDKKLHIVAAPGAGKTILGLEVIRRIGKHCLILAPTITIKNQWAMRIKQSFLTDENLADELISTDILDPKTITISTYQGLLAGLCGQKEEKKDINQEISEETENVKEEKAFTRLDVAKAANLISKLQDQKIDLLCFDEAHHLRKEWWKALDYIMKNLNPATTLSLTATPPYDVDINEWNRYEELCGPVDESISIPELVKNGDLCPHQDLIYFSPLRKEEDEAQDIYMQKAKSFYLEFLQDEIFAVEAFHLPIFHHPKDYLEFLYDDPDFYIAFASYLNCHNMPISNIFYELFDAKQKNFPEFNLILAETLINGLIFKHKNTFPHLTEYIDALYQKAIKSHLIFQKTLYLSGNPKLTKEMAKSIGKLDAIEEIVTSEIKQLQQNLRLVILADYIKMEAFSSQTETLGVIPIFIRLAKMQLNNISVGVLSGKIILIPQNKKDCLIEAMKSTEISEEDITFRNSKYFSDYCEVIPKESVRAEIIHLITKLFNDGNLNILIGTQALLGEGWDAPAVNSLILSSTVASYMLSNQMRGRAIRIEKGNPDKVSHIWHLVSTRTYNITDELKAFISKEVLEKDGVDFEKVRRRFEGYEAPTLSFPYNIQNGIERCLSEKLSDFYYNMTNKNHLTDLTKKMLSYSRSETKTAWEQGLFMGTGMGIGRLKVGVESPQIKLKNFMFCDEFLSRFAYAGAISYAILQGLSPKAVASWNFFILSASVLGFISCMFFPTLRIIQTGRPEGILKQISLVILETLFEANIISTNPKMSSLSVNKSGYGYYISAGTLSQRDNNISRPVSVLVYNITIADTSFPNFFKNKNILFI